MPVYMDLGDIKGDASAAPAADAQPYLQIEMANVLVSSWQSSDAAAMETMKKAWKDASSTPEGAVDGGAREGTHEVGHWLDTIAPSAPAIEGEGGLIYSGESGGINEASVPQFSGGVFVAAGNSAAPPEAPPDDFSVSKESGHEGAFYLKLQGVDGDSASLPPERQATLTMFTADYGAGFDQNGRLLVGNDHGVFAVKLPDVLVTGWQTSASDAAPDGHLYLATEVGVFEHHVGGIDGVWGLDRIDQYPAASGPDGLIDAHHDAGFGYLV